MILLAIVLAWCVAAEEPHCEQVAHRDDYVCRHAPSDERLANPPPAPARQP